ncbi:MULTISPECIES: CrcB family protein [unclassified Cyanobium]|uniref:fluoride efflux transporter FluC n=1 Tax=unclassified Cyanobium TaxID=2627006 RepID=UPI001647A69E|nr:MULTISPECIES: CrcB family protein [unclassified Cyanobium]MBE9153302.1 CrcB family protein [Cyanobium sp. LEGE 06113]QNI71691.1 fluoride exporter [Cyanobium sp. NS01]
MREPLKRESKELLLLTLGAVPGGLLRWQLDLAAAAQAGPGAALLQASLLANLSGCLLIGLLIVQPASRARLYLWAGVGFCGSLTTFSSWMLSIAQQLTLGHWLGVTAIVAGNLLGGLLLVACGAWLGSALLDRNQP